MRVEINDQGELVIEGESQLEFYALSQWAKEHKSIVNTVEASGSDNSHDLVINTHSYQDK